MTLAACINLLDLIGIADNLDRKVCVRGQRLGFGAQFLVAPGEKNRLHVEFAAHEFAENFRNVAAANPSGVNEHGELLRVESERATRRLSRTLIRKVQTSDARASPIP